MRSGWLLGPDRAKWLERLVAEAAESREGRSRVVWLLGGVIGGWGAVAPRRDPGRVDVDRRGCNRRVGRVARPLV